MNILLPMCLLYILCSSVYIRRISIIRGTHMDYEPLDLLQIPQFIYHKLKVSINCGSKLVDNGTQRRLCACVAGSAIFHMWFKQCTWMHVGVVAWMGAQCGCIQVPIVIHWSGGDLFFLYWGHLEGLPRNMYIACGHVLGKDQQGHSAPLCTHYIGEYMYIYVKATTHA